MRGAGFGPHPSRLSSASLRTRGSTGYQPIEPGPPLNGPTTFDVIQPP